MGKPTLDLGNDFQLKELATRIMYKIPELNTFSLDQLTELIKSRIDEIMNNR